MRAVILQHCNDIDYVFGLDFPDFYDLYMELQEKELEQKTWELWLALYPHMSKETYISYEDMLAKAKRQEVIGVQRQTPTSGYYVDQIGF